MSKLSVIILLSSSLSIFGQERLKMTIGAEKVVPIMGYNANMAHAPSWKDASFINALNNLKPKILRYPGGSNSFYWNWEKGWTKSFNEFYPYLKSSAFRYQENFINSDAELKLLTQKNKGKDSFWTQLNRYTSKKPKYNTIPLFSRGIKQTNSKAIFCLNLISSSIQNEIEMLKKAEEEGIFIEYIELGNEINHPNLVLEHFYPTEKSYADTCIKWVKELWKVFPHAKIGVVGGNKNNRSKNWNETLTTEFEKEFPQKKNQINFILHYYFHLKKPIYQLDSSDEKMQFFAYSKFDIERKLKWWNWKEIQNYTTWITEYNISEKKPHKINNTWAHGLFVSNQTHQLLRLTNTSVFNFHSIGSDAFPGFAVLDLINKDERYLQATAAGIVTSLWNKLTADAENLYNINLNNQLWEVYYPSKHTCNCPNNPQIPTNVEFNPIHAYKSSNAQQKKLLICNTSETTYQLTLSDIGINKGKMEQYSGSLTHDVRGELNQGDDWKVTKKAVNNTIEIPPYSITLIEE